MDCFVRRRTVQDKRGERHADHRSNELRNVVEHCIPQRHFPQTMKSESDCRIEVRSGLLAPMVKGRSQLWSRPSLSDEQRRSAGISELAKRGAITEWPLCTQSTGKCSLLPFPRERFRMTSSRWHQGFHSVWTEARKVVRHRCRDAVMR